jgi:outer membrane protein OmpA-like peptidoglycan-associated protein
LKNYCLLFIITLLFSITACKVAKTSKTKYMQKIMTDLKENLPKEISVISLNDTIRVLFPNNISFKNGADVLEPNFYDPLKKFTDVLNKYDKTTILVGGHTDNVGDADYNFKLSKTRAENVKKAMLDNKVLVERLTTWGYGETNPLAPNDTEENKAKNRVVEFKVMYKLDN